MIFAEDANSFTLNVTPLNGQEQLSPGLWLALIGIDETPPHIALIAGGKYYSVSARKVDCGTSTDRLFNSINRKQIPALFVQCVTVPAGVQNFEPLQKVYKGLNPLGNTGGTCLSPIKDFFSSCYSPDFTGVNFIFELLALAERKGLLKECVSLFCKNVHSKSITLPKYTMVQINKKISMLSPNTTSVNN